VQHNQMTTGKDSGQRKRTCKKCWWNTLWFEEFHNTNFSYYREDHIKIVYL